MADATEIHGHTIYIVEGQTDASFIARLAHRLFYAGNRYDPEQFDSTGHQTLITKGKENLPEFLKALPTFSGFNGVKRLIVMQDADESLDSTLASICSHSDNHLKTSFGAKPKENTPSSDPSGRQVFPWVAPFMHEQGDLERILWEAVAKSDHVQCVESFLDCVEMVDPVPIGSRWKALVDSYLVTLSEPTYKVSHWFQQAQFPWESPAFDEFKSRLNDLRARDPQ